MAFLREIIRTDFEASEDVYPFTLDFVRNMQSLSLDCPVVILAGDNGVGKSTLINIICTVTGAQRIGESRAAYTNGAARLTERMFVPKFSRRPKRSFLFVAEDFTRYIDRRTDMINEEKRELERVEREYAGRSKMAKDYAAMPHARGLFEMENMYGSELSQRSHGEGYIDFFGARLAEGGLYLLDEPEGALSYLNQYVLMSMISESVENGSQFIISTHSPVILAYPGALLYELTDKEIRTASYEELPNVSFLRSYLAAPERYAGAIVRHDE